MNRDRATRRLSLSTKVVQRRMQCNAMLCKTSEKCVHANKSTTVERSGQTRTMFGEDADREQVLVADARSSASVSLNRLRAVLRAGHDASSAGIRAGWNELSGTRAMGRSAARAGSLQARAGISRHDPASACLSFLAAGSEPHFDLMQAIAKLQQALSIDPERADADWCLVRSPTCTSTMQTCGQRDGSVRGICS